MKLRSLLTCLLSKRPNFSQIVSFLDACVGVSHHVIMLLGVGAYDALSSASGCATCGIPLCALVHLDQIVMSFMSVIMFLRILC